VNPEVPAAMVRPPLSHTSSAFAALMQEYLDGLREILDASDGQPLLIPESGPIAMEMALSNLVEPGDRVAVMDAGHFAAWMAELAEWLDAQVIRVTAEPGVLPDETRSKRPCGKGQTSSPSPTSTSPGVMVPVERRAPLAHRYSA
jgi:alanine-glyoxylate transaminase/serine-glyoxylate transaminase/serine-pyruvate transaminase